MVIALIADAAVRIKNIINLNHQYKPMKRIL